MLDTAATIKRKANRRSLKRVVRAQLYRLKIGDIIHDGDWCCDERDIRQPVRVIHGGQEVAETTHPHYRITDAF